MTASRSILEKPAAREALIFVTLLLVGLILLPIAIYVVGQLVFGNYGGSGLTGFFEQIYRGLPSGDGVVWFLVLSPYLGWQGLRATIWLFRHGAPTTTTRSR
ncbi:MAG: hypothetical protein GXP15_02865 [Gammaproteobacteria bacterium]|nr:hypothetical protein [Gammaproteobacteria bacterium]